jgi:hypothetical protein
VVILVDGLPIEDKKANMFSVGASMGEFTWALVIGEMFLFQRLAIFPSMCTNPLAWWKTHEGRFLNVALLEILSFATNHYATSMPLVVICNYLNHVCNYKFGIV